ncbi:ankyrin [Piromyces finnis]|uniref:Ankyrin n=1 Tax=Piromyces finnis TaxID=1754191 RepID=A0A1Y1VA52_9FUNG|nr:ankyrin [Piromyces finnis]|eukprot:ORX51055.1 ankyrin [Piromyces finnis]
MKFGKHIQKIQRREWSRNYMSYKDLKKIINNINILEEGKPSYPVTITAPNPPGTDDNLSKEMTDLKTSFFFNLECELEKVNTFYLQKESEYKIRLQNLIEIKTINQSKKNHISDESLINLASLFHYFLNDVTKLQEFVEVNFVGFRKILKKWDKRTKSITKDMYLARQVEIQPCFNRTILNEMSETATHHFNELKQSIPEETDIDNFPSQSLKSSTLVAPKDNLLYNYERLIVRLILSGKTEEMKQNLHKALPLIENASDEDFYNRVFLRLCKECKYNVINPELTTTSTIDNPNINLNKEKDKNELLERKPSSSSLQNSISGIFINSSLNKSSLVNKISIQDILNIINIFILEIQPRTINFNYFDKIKHQTCLHLTAINNQVELMKFCVENGADIYKNDIFGRIPLHYVAMNGDIECTNFFIQAFNNQISSPISVKSNKSDDVFDDIDQDGYSPTLYAIVRGHSSCLKILLENYKSIDFTTSLTKLYHPLSLACEYGHKNVLLTLLEHGVKEEMNSDGLFPLHLACREGHAEIAKILIHHGSDINGLDKDNGWTPIFYCLSDGHIDCVKILLDSGCKTNIKDEYGWYPLTYALYHGHIKIAQLLSPNAKLMESKSFIMDPESLEVTSYDPPISSSSTGTSHHHHFLQDSMMAIDAPDRNHRSHKNLAKHKIINEAIYSINPSSPTSMATVNPTSTTTENTISTPSNKLNIYRDEDHDEDDHETTSFTNDYQPQQQQQHNNNNNNNNNKRIKIKDTSSLGLNKSNLPLKSENLDPEDDTMSFVKSCTMNDREQTENNHSLATVNDTYHSIMEIPENSRIIPIAPSHLFSDIGNDENLDIDSLPPLSLPPPLVPFKLYGHNYLQKRIYLQIKLENFTDPNQSPLTIYGTQNFCSLRLIIRTDPECSIPYDIILPQKPEDKLITFFIDKDQDVNVEIMVDRAFSNQLIGKAVILSECIKKIIKNGRGDGSDPIEQCTVSLMDSRLHVIGKLCLKIFSISPFSHPSLEIGGKVQTYWKSTATTKLVNKSNQEVSNLSFITASSLSEEYMLLPIQLTKDGIPVVYSQWNIEYHGMKFNIHDITFEQFKFFGEKITSESSSRDKSNTLKDNLLKSFNYESIENYSNIELINLIYKSYLSLEEILKTLSHRIGLNIEVGYPTESVRNKFNFELPYNINQTVDILLQTVYNYGDQRSIIFTSFNPYICTTLKWKQPNCKVFFGTCCGYKINYDQYHYPNLLYCDNTEQEDIQTEKICSSLKEAITFARDNHLIGIFCEATPLIQRPILINTIKESGLFLTTFGKYNFDPNAIKLQEKFGVDAVVINGIVRILK